MRLKVLVISLWVLGLSTSVWAWGRHGRGGFRSPYGGAYFTPYYPAFPYPYAEGYVDSGAVRLQVHPKEARVFVDGYYVGIVDDSKHLSLARGPHEIALKLEGFKIHRFRIYASANHTLKLRYELVHGTGEDESDDLAPPPTPAVVDGQKDQL